jgi:TRAP-type mannitol/chloroaromatic compound transport system permease small subunit
MKALEAFCRGTTWLNEMVGRATAFLVLAMFALLLAEVAFRYLLRAPSVWTGELSQMLFGAYALLGGGYLLARNGHVNVDLVYANFPRRRRAAIDVVTSVLFFLFIGVLVWQGASLAMESVAKWERSHSAWNPAIWPIKLVIPISALLLLLQGLVKLTNDLRVAFGREPIDTGAGEQVQGDQL